MLQAGIISDITSYHNFMVNTSNTYNFVDQAVIKWVEGKPQPIVNLMVTVATGEKLKSQKFCHALQFEVQGESVLADFFYLTFAWL